MRRHGVYVWGDSWEKAKCMAECYDYLFEIAVKMKGLGLDPEKVPNDSEYKHLSEINHDETLNPKVFKDEGMLEKQETSKKLNSSKKK